jgi:hypothetical protein
MISSSTLMPKETLEDSAAAFSVLSTLILSAAISSSSGFPSKMNASVRFLYLSGCFWNVWLERILM